MNEHKSFALFHRVSCVKFCELSVIYVYYKNLTNVFNKSIDFQIISFYLWRRFHAAVSFRFSLSLSLSLSALHRLRYSFSLFSRSIARRGRGDAATPCPSIPLRLAIRGSQPWSKYFVISLPDSHTIMVVRRCNWLGTAAIRLYILLIIS